MSVIKDHQRVDGVAVHRMGRAKARDIATVVGRKTTRAKGLGVSDMTDRASKDKTEAWRRKTHGIDHPVPGVHEGKIRPMAGFLWARVEEAHQGAKALGLVIPDIADRHTGQGKLARFTIEDSTPCRDEDIGSLLGETERGVRIYQQCQGACALPVGSVVLAASYAGTAFDHILGKNGVALRCHLVVAVEE